MAEFHTRKGIVHYLDRIIREAEEELVLISPYIKADNETEDILKNKKRSTKIHVIYGKRRLKPAEQSFFNDISIEPSFRKNLHAKCYLNEKEVLVTSMNLYEFSQEHNDEMGILVSRDQEPELYEKIREESMRLVEASESGKETATRKESPSEMSAPKNGFCIQCKDHLPADPTKPYCRPCFANWSVHKDRDNKENYCHICGNKRKTSRRKPSCLACYKEYSGVLEWPAS